MKITSPHWDETLGVCTKHGLPSIPCPACLAGDGDEDLEFVVTETDALVLDFGQAATLRDLVPANIINPAFVSGF